MPIKDIEAYNKYHNEYMKRRYTDTVVKLRDYKVQVGCKDCGYNAHHAGLQFDHVIERKGNINTVISKLTCRGFDVVMKHINENCEVVCSTCHSIRTWERRQDSNSTG